MAEHKAGPRLKIHQLNAFAVGAKQRASQALGIMVKAFDDKAAEVLFTGVIARYEPLDADAAPADRDRPLSEKEKHLQARMTDLLPDIERAFSDQWDIMLRQDASNQVAKAPVIVNGKLLVEDAPVSWLLRMEKELETLRGVAAMIPVTDGKVTWSYDRDLRAHRSPEAWAYRLAKRPQTQLLAEATDKHPAQVRWFDEDVPVGKWYTTLVSGGWSPAYKAEVLARIGKLADAVKSAREAANAADAVDRTAAKEVFDFLLGR